MNIITQDEDFFRGGKKFEDRQAYYYSKQLEEITFKAADLEKSLEGRNITFSRYEGLHQFQKIQDLISKELSEPYTIFTFRYFLDEFPQLCWIAWHDEELIGVIIGKMSLKEEGDDATPAISFNPGEEPAVINSGYIAMVAVNSNYRKKNIGSILTLKCLAEFFKLQADQIVLETEVSNHAAVKMYTRLGFRRITLLPRYYQNGNDAFRFKYYCKMMPNKVAAIQAIESRSFSELPQANTMLGDNLLVKITAFKQKFPHLVFHGVARPESGGR